MTYKSTYSNFHFLISLLFSHRDMMCSIDNSNSFNPQLISRSNVAHVTCIMHHYLVLFAWHCSRRFQTDRRGFQTEICTIYSDYTIELHTFTSRAQKQHIASLVCITFIYHVCFPFDAHIHYLTVQPSSHFQFVQHSWPPTIISSIFQCYIVACSLLPTNCQQVSNNLHTQHKPYFQTVSGHQISPHAPEFLEETAWPTLAHQ